MMATNRTLLEQARELQALAQTGLMYCKDPFDRERYDCSAPDIRRRNSTLVRPSSMKKAGSS